MASLTLIFTRSVGTWQPTRLLGRVGSKFNWPSEDQCQRSHSNWVFGFIPHLKSKYIQLSVSKLSQKSAICPRRSPWRLILFWCALSGPRDWTLRHWSRAWPTLTWFAKFMGVSMSSSVRNTNFTHTLKPWNSGTLWGNLLRGPEIRWIINSFESTAPAKLYILCHKLYECQSGCSCNNCNPALGVLWPGTGCARPQDTQRRVAIIVTNLVVASMEPHCICQAPCLYFHCDFFAWIYKMSVGLGKKKQIKCMNNSCHGNKAKIHSSHMHVSVNTVKKDQTELFTHIVLI